MNNLSLDTSDLRKSVCWLRISQEELFYIWGKGVRKWSSCVSPNTVIRFFRHDTGVWMVLVNNKILVGVMGWVEVGDHPTRDPQQTHHWNKIKIWFIKTVSHHSAFFTSTRHLSISRSNQLPQLTRSNLSNLSTVMTGRSRTTLQHAIIPRQCYDESDDTQHTGLIIVNN